MIWQLARRRAFLLQVPMLDCVTCKLDTLQLTIALRQSVGANAL